MTERVAKSIATTAPAEVMKLTDYGLHLGAQANLIVLATTDWHQAIQFQVDKAMVILRGKLAAQTRRESELFLF